MSRIVAYFRSLLDKTPSSGEVLVELDGLRGLAVLIVIASHSNAFGMKGQGGMGVWLFFVLSGFLLTKILLSKLPESLRPTALARYFVRRIARIIPLYYSCLVVTMLASGKDLEWLLRHFLFLQADGHFWSIPQEELFYILLPILAAVSHFAGRLIPPWMIALGIVVAVQASHPLFRINGNFTRLAFYANVFVVGFLLAHLWSTRRFRLFVRSRSCGLIWSLLGLAALWFVLFTSKAYTGFYNSLGADVSFVHVGWRYSTHSAYACALLLVATLKNGTWMNSLFSWIPLRVLGVLSFSLYLFHMFVIKLLSSFGFKGVALFFASLLVSTAVALITERVVERPFMSLGRRVDAGIRTFCSMADSSSSRRSATAASPTCPTRAAGIVVSSVHRSSTQDQLARRSI